MATDIKYMTPEQRDDLVQEFLGRKHFMSAAEIISQWVYWDEVKKELAAANPELEEPQDEEREEGMQEKLSDRMQSEFGDSWAPEKEGKPFNA